MVAVYDPIPRTDSNVVLIGGDWNHGFVFPLHSVGNVIIPTDSYFFRGVGIPPTRLLTIINHIITIIINDY